MILTIYLIDKFKNHQLPTDLVMGTLQCLITAFAQSPETILVCESIS